MRTYKTIISSTEPTQGDVLWAKPNNDNFILYLLDDGKWKPIEAEGGGSGTSIQSGSFQDAPENPVNGQLYFCTGGAYPTTGFSIWWPQYIFYLEQETEGEVSGQWYTVNNLEEVYPDDGGDSPK